MSSPTAIMDVVLPTVVAEAGDVTSDDLLWIVIAGFIVSFILAFGVGANDVANSFGTSVGSKVLTIRQACILATIFEIAGAVLIGYKVSDTMRKGIIDPAIYNNSNSELMIGNLAALGGSGVWLMMATFLKLPISGTHSIVGATIGFSLVARGTEGIQWWKLAQIVSSWFISPILSGLISSILFVAIRRLILRKPAPLEYGLRALPIFYALTLTINVFSIVLDGPKLLLFDRIPWWGAMILSSVIGLVAGLFVQFLMVPRLRKSILEGGTGGTGMERSGSGGRAKFTFGDGTGSAESSASVTPDDSRNVSMDELPYGNGTALHSRNKRLTPPTNKMRFGFRKSQAKTITLAGAEDNDAETRIDSGKPIKECKSDQPTPIHGLSPCSSAVPLISQNTAVSLNRALDNAAVDVESAVRPSGGASAGASVEDPPEVVRLFSFLQIMTASFGAFAHGGNDVSNAIGPLVAIWLIYSDHSVMQKSETPFYILFFGGVGIAVGLWVWGRRVIKTVGEDLTKLTASSGFTIEIGAAFTVLVASKIGVPISTTHCKVGSVVFVGWAQTSKGGVDWHLFRNIIFAWVVTVPIAGGLSAALMAIFQAAHLY
jgi:sodium-dependent phosphate transporter